MMNELRSLKEAKQKDDEIKTMKQKLIEIDKRLKESEGFFEKYLKTKIVVNH